ncbi:DUF317 domain-containing protein [Streptomyces niveus]|uniref:DUF317 domain-containing protein n=1 Tax=Streptomyces niveus TaxID=193462 RepID=A0ABZ1ZXW6_STRNV|nr:DUF317 domain-containing protein [Streptomyces niveus]
MTKTKKKQWAGWGPGERPEQHYLVAPRHLAGGGDLRHVSEYLRASGWRDRSKTGGPLVFDSPDRTVRVGYDPFVQPGGWTISGKRTPSQDAWYATFGPRVPVEIVAGFTDALTESHAAHAPNVWQPLHWQGWSGERVPHVGMSSPDGTAFLQFHQSGPGQAMWWARAATEYGTAWHATFTPTTPMHLITAFTTALAHPDPVMRPRGHVPPSRHIRTRSMSVTPSQLRAWQQTRITAARATTWARNTAARRRPGTTPAGPRQTAGGSYARR